MKASRYTEAQILAILRHAEGGVPVAELCREHRMSDASFYKWRAKYGGMDASIAAKTGASCTTIILVIVGLLCGVVCAKPL
jgi:putative transposase